MIAQEVGLAVGYEDVALFRDLFKRHNAQPPGAVSSASVDRSRLRPLERSSLDRQLFGSCTKADG